MGKKTPFSLGLGRCSPNTDFREEEQTILARAGLGPKSLSAIWSDQPPKSGSDQAPSPNLWGGAAGQKVRGPLGHIEGPWKASLVGFELVG